MKLFWGFVLVLFSAGVAIYSAQQLLLHQLPTRGGVNWSHLERRHVTDAPVVLVQDGDQFYEPGKR